MSGYRCCSALDAPARHSSQALYYGLMILISCLLHAGAWQFRHWLQHQALILPKPRPPLEVTLTTAPQPFPVSPAPAAPAASVLAAPPAPEPPKPKAQPAPKLKAPPRAAPVATTKVEPIRPPEPKPPPQPKSLPKPKPVAAPDPRPLPPPVKLSPIQPTRREIKDDPNLPPVVQPIVRPIEKPPEPPPRPAPKLRPLPPPRDEDDPHQLPDRPALETTATRELAGRAHPATARSAEGQRPAATGAVPDARSAPRSSKLAGAAALGTNAGGTYEGAKAHAAYLHNPKPEYPSLARRQQWEGRVILKVRVLANGTAAAVSVATSSGHEVLDEAALEAVHRWHFVPAKRGGQAVDSVVNVPINFNLLDSP